jgi:RNA polymerase sigma-70 factor (ECF subfamily)
MSFQPNPAVQNLYISCRGELEAVLFSRVGCRETAADISQEAFTRLCRASDLSNVDNLKAYLYRTAMNLVIDHYRNHATHTASVVECLDDAIPEVKDRRCAETVVLGEQELDQLVDSLSALSPLCQRIFYLNRFEGLKHREIAETLNISIRTVEENIKRALLHCVKTANKS